MGLSIIILAAGQGKRMHSALPKVLQPLAGRPLLRHVIDTAHALEADAVHVVYGHGGERVMSAIGDDTVRWALQEQQLGTGHAVAQAMPPVPDDHLVLVLYGDVPLTRVETLRGVVDAAGDDRVALLTVELDEPVGYGRILRGDNGNVERIVEQKDASSAERAIREVNSGILAAPAGRLRGWLDRLGNDNRQGEYYLTDVIAAAVADGLPVTAVRVDEADEVLGVNDKSQLAHLERACQRRIAAQLMRDGVTLIDPARLDVRGTLRTGRDVTIDVGVIFEGEVTLGEGVRVGPYCVLRNTHVEAGTVIEPHCVIDSAEIGPHCAIGPFARIRPGTRMAERAKVGNFVEVKKALIGPGSKVSHLSYIGDAELGRDVNIGAGTITCNYDGRAKHMTRIGDGVFIGSDTQLVAPVTVGEGATIGAGSTITKDVPPGGLTLTRAPQKSLPQWVRPADRKQNRED